MNIQSIKTRILNPPQDDLISVIKETVLEIPENSILVITSKVVSIWLGRCVPIKNYASKDELVKEEADKYLERDLVPQRHVMHSIKNNLLIPSAGVDESNRTGYYILWPIDPMQTAADLHKTLQQHYKTKNFGILITDSHSVPLRRGMIGVSLSHFGFQPLKDYREDPKRKKTLGITQSNLADGLAAAAVTVMGESNEQTPLALITDIAFINFGEQHAQIEPFGSFEVKENDDLYYPFLKNVPWKKGGSGKDPQPQ